MREHALRRHAWVVVGRRAWSCFHTSAFLLLALLLAPACAQENIHFGVDTTMRREWSRAEIRSTFSLWAQELTSRFKLPVTVSYYDDVGSLRRDFLAGKIDAVNADALTFVRYFKPGELAEGYATVMQGGWNLELYAGRNTRGRELLGIDDLAGKRIVLMDQDEISEMVLETLCMRQYRRDCKDVFSEMQRVQSNNQALMRVYFGKADLALMQGYGYALSAEMNPQLARSVRRIAEYPIPSLYFAFYSARVDKALRQRTLRIIPTLHTYPRGRQLLDMFKIDRLEIATPADLQPIIDLEREYRFLKLRMAHQ